jgi:cell division septum initiation protein DivIVA
MRPMKDKRLTREEIRRAILRIERGRPKRIPKERCKLNISSVAREAGISAASIHNTYPDIAETIRAKARRSARSVMEDIQQERKRLLELLRQARERVKAAEKDLVRIASDNARLITENAVLRARLRSRNVVELASAATRSPHEERSPTLQSE